MAVCNLTVSSLGSIQFSGYLRIPHFPPIFPPDIWILTFFINVPLRKLVTPKKNGGNRDEPKSHFPPFFHKVYSIMVTKFCLML